jgi:choline dehydrogenase-like flavoprotein
MPHPGRRPHAGGGRGRHRQRRRRRDGGNPRAGRPDGLIEEGGEVLAGLQDARGAGLSALYQESAARKTRDKAINILQGRTVGGSTTVNWTSSFRTPPGTLAYWRRHFGLAGYTADAMAPWFAMMEQRLHERLARRPTKTTTCCGAAPALGIPTAAIRRNVNGCWNLGYCGMGCPTNAKQSMLVTTIPSALALARACSCTRAERFAARAGASTACGAALDAAGLAPTGAS